jgi:hypothetical protein
MDGNIIQSPSGIFGGACTFDLTKRYLGNDKFYGVRIVYMYGGSGFALDKIKGARLILNETEGFFLKFRLRPTYEVSTVTSGGGQWIGTGGGGMMYTGGPSSSSTSTKIVAECLLTNAQFASLLKADTIELNLLSGAGDNNPPEKKVFTFSEDNKNNLIRFYKEQVKI